MCSPRRPHAWALCLYSVHLGIAFKDSLCMICCALGRRCAHLCVPPPRGHAHQKGSAACGEEPTGCLFLFQEGGVRTSVSPPEATPVKNSSSSMCVVCFMRTRMPLTSTISVASRFCKGSTMCVRVPVCVCMRV